MVISRLEGKCFILHIQNMVWGLTWVMLFVIWFHISTWHQRYFLFSSLCKRYNFLIHDIFYLVWLIVLTWFSSNCVTVLIGLLYVISGFGGSLLSGLFIQSNISVGASGALFGLLGGMLSELITNWSIYDNKVLIKLLAIKKEVYSYTKPIGLIMIFWLHAASSTLHPCCYHCN